MKILVNNKNLFFPIVVYCFQQKKMTNVFSCLLREQWIVPEDKEKITRKKRKKYSKQHSSLFYQPKNLDSTSSRFKVSKNNANSESWLCEKCRYINMKMRVSQQ
jgi:hypothetical protein